MKDFTGNSKYFVKDGSYYWLEAARSYSQFSTTENLHCISGEDMEIFLMLLGKEKLIGTEKAMIYAVEAYFCNSSSWEMMMGIGTVPVIITQLPARWLEERNGIKLINAIKKLKSGEGMEIPQEDIGLYLCSSQNAQLRGGILNENGKLFVEGLLNVLDPDPNRMDWRKVEVFLRW